MNNLIQENLNLKCETFTGYTIDNIAFLQLHRDFLLRTENLNERDQVLEYLENVSTSNSIKLLIVAGAPDAKGKDEFFEFFKNFYDRGTIIFRLSPFSFPFLSRLFDISY